MRLSAIAAFASTYWAKSDVHDDEALLRHYEAQQLLHAHTGLRGLSGQPSSLGLGDVDVEYNEVLAEGLVTSPKAAAFAGGLFSLPALTEALESTAERFGELSRHAGKKAKGWIDNVLEYGVYLGMDPIEDTDLMWIAAQALQAPVPEGWEERMDPFGDVYWLHRTTGQRSRQHPMDGHFQELFQKYKLMRDQGIRAIEDNGHSHDMGLSHEASAPLIASDGF